MEVFFKSDKSVKGVKEIREIKEFREFREHSNSLNSLNSLLSTNYSLLSKKKEGGIATTFRYAKRKEYLSPKNRQ